jgi:glycerol kinase
MRADGAGRLEALRVDGGMAANGWFCQFLADILNLAVERPANLETTALGAAMLAAHASGAWAQALNPMAGANGVTTFVPAMQDVERTRLVSEWQAAIRRATAP